MFAKKNITQQISDKNLDKETKIEINRIERKKGGKITPKDESYTQMLRRMLANHDPWPNKKLHVINDECHHCYLGKNRSQDDDEARKWFELILKIKGLGWLHGVSDFSATPIYPAGQKPKNLTLELFPWTVSDFPLIEAVECGLTKIPRLPESVSGEDSMKASNIFTEQNPSSLKHGISNDVKKYLAVLVKHHLKKSTSLYKGVNTIICIVANDIDNANIFFNHIAGKYGDKSSILWPELSNINENGEVKENPPTLLVHSKINSKSGELDTIYSDSLFEFFGKVEDKRAKKQALAKRIEELFLTAGMKGKPGEHIRCIVSVDKLTEGWDCKNVTEIFGYRAFGSELLREQVTGRALRRTNYEVQKGKNYCLQIANLIGVPFNWMPVGKQPTKQQVIPPSYWCIPLPDNEGKKIIVPNVVGYRLRRETLGVQYDSKLARDCGLRIIRTGTKITISFAGGLTEDLTLSDDQESLFLNKFIWRVADKARILFTEKHEKANSSRWLMASMIKAVREWYFDNKNKATNLVLASDMPEVINAAAFEVLRTCPAQNHPPIIEPIFPSDGHDQSKRDTGTQGFLTSLIHQYPKIVEQEGGLLPEFEVNKSERNVAPCHSKPEIYIARILEKKLEGVEAWARNFILSSSERSLGLEIPYRNPRNGQWQRYQPDFVARTINGNHVVIEFKGDFPDKDEDLERQKRKFAEEYWIPAVTYSREPQCKGKWVYCYVEDVSVAKSQIANALNEADKNTSLN